MTDLLPEFIEFAHTLADAARTVIAPLFRTHCGVDIKADTSPVTIADKEAERIMREMITTRYPDHGILGEEFGNHQAEAKYVWVLDPVDGTKSFMSGIATFGTLISLVRLGVPVLGIIDQPITKERWLGIKESASTFNSNPIKTRPCPYLSKATLSTTSPDLFSAHERAVFETIRQAVRYTLYGYDCYAYAQLASGFIDAIIETGLKPHDFCALRPVIEGAGGIITDWQGKPLTLASDGRVLVAGDQQLHATLLKMLAKGAA